MAQNNTLGMNRTFPIYNADDTAFHDLELKKSAVESVVMSLGDKVTGDVFYKDNTLAVTMQEYIIVDGVKYMLVSPPTIVREGMVSDNTQLKGMTKYSFTFHHPMYMLGNFPFTDIAVTQDEEKYLSQNKTFSWIGTLSDFVDKLNANLASTEWLVSISSSVAQDKRNEIPDDVLSFDKQFISDALKVGYDTWKIPFVITPTTQVVNGVTKKFKIEFGLPSQEIYTIDAQGERTSTPFVFQFGKGVGLKNNSRTPRNNKIVTRIVGCGSERNVPFGYPQIIWSGNQQWDYTINNASGMQSITVDGVTIQAMSYPIYDGIVGGQKVRLIKHPFTRSTLMPSVYFDTVNKKVNPNATGYNPDIEIKDYYDAIDDETHEYPNNINLLSPSVELHQFEDIYPRLINQTLVSVSPYDGEIELISKTVYNTRIQTFKNQSANYNEKNALQDAYDKLALVNSITHTGGSYTYEYKRLKTQAYQYGTWYHVKYTSGNINFEYYVWDGTQAPQIDIVWDDTMNDDGEYVQSYFKMKLPVLNFDLYASAAVTQEMKINMRSGDCLGCTFPVQVDWDDYKANFYGADGNFDPVIGSGHPRNGDKYPDSSQGQITIVVQKETETFGTLMPNTYQQPASGDKFVILGISLPTSYITDAEEELDEAMKEYMLENNVHYYDYPLKFDEYFLATNTGILEQIQNNNIVRFQYAGTQMALYIKQITIKYGENPLPQYDITLTDDIEIVLNQIGQVTDDVSRMRVQVSELQKYYSENLIQEINNKLSRIQDDVCQGRITFQQGLDAIGSVIFQDEVRSPQFESGLYTGRGWRIDNLGNAEFESIRVRSYLEVVELLVNRLQAQEGDTLFTDNDQIDRVDRIVDETDGSVSYVLSLKEKYQGYITGQMYGNVVKGIINTLAAKQAGVSDVQDSQTVEIDGSNTYYTSWMQVIATHNTNNPDNSLGVNQIKVVLYGDDYYDEGHEGDPDHLHHITPAGKNFEPCELMTIARWGCVDYSNPQDPNYATIKASITRRQRMFMISTTEGRVVKYTGVDSPILRNGNYGVTIGELPEFVKNYSDVRAILNQVGEHTDWLYAQGVVVGKFIKVDIEGNPEPNIIDCGNWVNGVNVVSPTPRNGVYLYNEWNSQTQQYETHDVWHNNSKWRCKMTQPVVSGGVAHYYEPTDANSAYWQKLASGGQDGNSVIIAGYADYYHDKDYLDNDMPAQVSETEVGQINLKAYTDPNGDIIDVGEEGNSDWQSYSVPVGTCYILRGNYHLYEATENGWLDLGRFKGEDGASPFIADLDNEMDSVACDVDGKPSSTQTVSTNVNLYYGTSKRYFTVGVFKNAACTQAYTNSSTLSNGIAVWWNSSSLQENTINVKVSDALTIDGKITLYIRLTDSTDNNIKRILTFTINGVRAGEDGEPVTIYNLTPSVNAISIGDGTTSQSIQMGILKTMGDSVSEVAMNFSYRNPLHILYSVTNVPVAEDNYSNTSETPSAIAKSHLVANWGREIINSQGAVVSDGITATSASTLTISPTVTFSKIYVSLFKEVSGEYILIDSETIPIVKDGAKGDNAQYIYLKGTAHDASNEIQTTINPEVSINGGSNLATNQRGLNLVTINRQTLAFVESINYDTYGEAVSESGRTGLTDLYAKLNALDNSVFVCLVSHDAIGWNSNLITMLQSYGMGDLLYTDANRYPFLFIGYKNLGKGNGLTRMRGTGNYYDVVELSAYVANGALTLKDGKDGQDGQDALNLVLDTYSIAFPTDSDYYVENELRYTVGAKMFLGNNTQQTITTNINATSDDGDVYVNGTTNSINITIGEARFQNKITISVTATCSLGTRTAEIYLTAVPMGAVGSRGKTGRFYYYAGEFDVNDNTHTFFVNDAQAPYFNTGGTKFHVYNSDTNGSFTMAQMGDNFNSAPWEIMTNDFKYIITEAIFGKYAHFGSFIINGDWMLSQHGTLVSSGGTEIIVDESNQDIQHDNGATTIVLNGNSVNSGLIVCQVSFTVDTNTQVSITITPSSESNFDFGAVGELDSVELKNATAAKIKNNTVTSLIKASGTTAASTTVNVSAGTHFFYIAYAKDGSSAQGSDNATFSFGSLTYSVDLVKKSDGMTYTSPKWGVAYTWFDDQDPLAKTTPSTGYKFRPNFAVDALTGSTYQNKAYVAGNILTPYLRITNNNYSNYQHTNFMDEVCLWLDKSGFNVQIEASSITQIKLPRITSDMLGSEINIFNATTGEIEVYGSGSSTGQSSKRYFCPLIKPSAASNLRTNFNISISKFMEAKFKAIDNGYVGNTDEETERYRYSWLCCYANINP